MKTVLITGASRGIGRELALAFGSAGYAVGVRRETSSVASAPASGATLPRDSQPSRVLAAATPTVATPTATSQASAAGHRTTGSAPAKPVRDTTKPVLPATVPNVAARPALPDSTSTSTAEAPVRVNEFLTYDRQSRTVSLQLIAGYNGLNGSLNYNGATNGRHGLYVPVGWRIHVAVTKSGYQPQEIAPTFSTRTIPWHLNIRMHRDGG